MSLLRPGVIEQHKTNSNSLCSGPGGAAAAVMPQYYSVQAPWGLYPAAGLLQQQQQQGLPGQQAPAQAPAAGTPTLRGQTPRSLTPSQEPTPGGLQTPTGIHIIGLFVSVCRKSNLTNLSCREKCTIKLQEKLFKVGVKAPWIS